MTKQIRNILLCGISLFLGGILYVLFRENTYIFQIAEKIPFVHILRVWLNPIRCDFLSYYLPDLIWAFSLASGLQTVFPADVRDSLLCGIFAFLCGAVWEVLQFCHIISGTGDLLDIALYFCGSALSTILNLKERTT